VPFQPGDIVYLVGNSEAIRKAFVLFDQEGTDPNAVDFADDEAS
jgi:hypothetical protein